MKVSEFINILQDAKNRWGNITLGTFDGDVEFVGVTPSKDGVVIENNEEPDKIIIEINIKY